MTEYDDSWGRDTPAPRRTRKKRSFGKIATIMGVLGLISLPIVPVVFVAGMFSIVGIPLAIVALIFPTLCLLTVLAYLCWRILPLQATTGVIAAFLIAAGIMTVVPLVHNALVVWDVKRLTAGDVQGTLPLYQGGGPLAVIAPATGRSTYCDELCVDLLVSGQVSRFVHGYPKRGNEVVDGSERVRVHQLRRGGGCSESKVSIRNAEWKRKQYGTVARALATAERNGACIQSSEEMKLADLGDMTVVSFLGKDNIDHAKSALLIGTMMEPFRFVVQAKSGAAYSSPVHQQTIVSYKPLKPVLAYAVGRIPSSNFGLWREDSTAKRPDLKALLTQAFGFRLRAE